MSNEIIFQNSAVDVHLNLFFFWNFFPAELPVALLGLESNNLATFY